MSRDRVGAGPRRISRRVAHGLFNRTGLEHTGVESRPERVPLLQVASPRLDEETSANSHLVLQVTRPRYTDRPRTPVNPRTESVINERRRLSQTACSEAVQLRRAGASCTVAQRVAKTAQEAPARPGVEMTAARVRLGGGGVETWRSDAWEVADLSNQALRMMASSTYTEASVCPCGPWRLHARAPRRGDARHMSSSTGCSSRWQGAGQIRGRDTAAAPAGHDWPRPRVLPLCSASWRCFSPPDSQAEGVRGRERASAVEAPGDSVRTSYKMTQTR